MILQRKDIRNKVLELMKTTGGKVVSSGLAIGLLFFLKIFIPSKMKKPGKEE